MENILSEKKKIRNLIKEKKKGHSEADRLKNSRSIFNQIETLPYFKSSHTVLVYWSIPGEVETHDFIIKWNGTKRIVLPVIVGDSLEIRTFSDLKELSPSNSFGILEPLTGNIVNPNEIDFAIIPGIAFDRSGNRLGRGKGYYDRLLKLVKGQKVGVGFRFQLVENLPIDSFDVPVDIVITNE